MKNPCSWPMCTGHGCKSYLVIHRCVTSRIQKALRKWGFISAWDCAMKLLDVKWQPLSRGSVAFGFVWARCSFNSSNNLTNQTNCWCPYRFGGSHGLSLASFFGSTDFPHWKFHKVFNGLTCMVYDSSCNATDLRREGLVCSCKSQGAL